MKTFQLTALLISAQMASSALADDKHWAYCHLYEKDYTDEPDEDETNDDENNEDDKDDDYNSDDENNGNGYDDNYYVKH